MLYLKLKKGDYLDIKYQEESARLKIIDLYKGHWLKLIYASEQSTFIMTVPEKKKFWSELGDNLPIHFYIAKSTPSMVMLGVRSFDSNIKINRRIHCQKQNLN